MLTKKSYERIMGAFKGHPISEIALLQSAYFNKDINRIRILLNKPNLSPSGALGQGNLANQYMKNIQTSEKQKQQLFIRYFKAPFSTSNSQANLQVAGNITAIQPSQTIQRQQIPTIATYPFQRTGRFSDMRTYITYRNYISVNRTQGGVHTFAIEYTQSLPSKEILTILTQINFGKNYIVDDLYRFTHIRWFAEITTNSAGIHRGSTTELVRSGDRFRIDSIIADCVNWTRSVMQSVVNSAAIDSCTLNFIVY